MLTITDGYSSSNFATAFKKHLDISPVDYRKLSEQMVEESSFSHGMTLDELNDAGKRITVEYLDRFTVIYARKKGNYHNRPEDWCGFVEKYQFLATEDLMAESMQFEGIMLPCGVIILISADTNLLNFH